MDDSAFMRTALSKMLSGDPEIEVVGTARDGLDAIEKVQRLDPDLVTMDVEMPRLDGLGALERIMAESPRPVVMVSSITEEGADVTLRALNMGAVDYIPKGIGKNVLGVVNIEKELRAKVKALGGKRGVPHVALTGTSKRSQPFTASASTSLSARTAKLISPRFILIGASTGGPPALHKFFSSLSPNFPLPVVVVQHMPKAFTGTFARRLSDSGPLDVKEAETGDRLEPGKGFVAPGGSHLVLNENNKLMLRVCDAPTDTLHKPSVDVTFASFAEASGSCVLAVILTGMGSDGLEGMRKLKAKGASIIAQEEHSCVVYGMPRVVVDAGLADLVLPIEDIAPAVEGSLK